jgi:basic amino acid/polyamine antiporter, APA family
VHDGLRRSLRLRDGLAVVIGIMVGSGIFRQPGVVAAQLGRPYLTFVAWILGGVVAFAGALIFAELGTRLPEAGGKYVYAREAFGPRAGFVVGTVEVGIYAVAIAALGVVAGEYTGALVALPAWGARAVGAGTVALFTLVNMAGVAEGRVIQNVATAAKMIALVGVVIVAFARGSGAGWSQSLPDAPTGTAAIAALAVAFRAVIWSYYGYPDAAKIAEEVIDPERNLPRIFLGSIAAVTALYVLLNAAFLHVLPFATVASSKLVAGDVATAIFGARGGMLVAGLALLVVLASINGNIFVTPRVVYAIARDGIGPPVLARVNRGGTPWAALIVVGAASIGLAITGTFVQLFNVAIILVMVIDGATALSLVPLRRRGGPRPAFSVPLFPLVVGGFVAVYGTLLAIGVYEDPWYALAAGGVLAGAAVSSVVWVNARA